MRRLLIVAVTAAPIALLQGCTSLPGTTSDGVELRREEVAIPFATQRSAVTSFQADGRDGLWVESGRGDWYYARFISPCIGVDHAIRLGFDTGTSGMLDRYSHVIVPNERDRCAIGSFTRSDPPPDGDRRNYEPD